MRETPVLIHHFLEESARRHPEKTAVVHDGLRTAYREVNARANRLARFLIDRGVQPGDRVVLMYENCLEYVVGYYGTLKTGAVSVPLSTDLKAEGLTHLLGEVEPAYLIASDRYEKLLHENNKQ